MKLAAAMFAAAMLVSCSRVQHRSPEHLRESYLEALPSDDAKAAYAMLTPEVQAQVPFDEFQARWKDEETERQTWSQTARALPSEDTVGLRGGTTAHEGGKVLTWSELDGVYYVSSGLPGTPQSTTPAQTVHALIAAVREADLGGVRALLGDALAEALAEDWQARVDAIEEALDRPGSIELSPDLRQAELRYDTGKALTLEQTPQGWRITALE
ncbi:MAG: DUF3887 domain-containing protein [Nannocystaceae bacterium]|nr:DUF3887 domain-containing protein [Nannocystaceae bacterium]